MTLHKKYAVFLVVLCIMSVWPCSGSVSRDNNISEDSDEDQKLKQALFLVDLLKKEYVRALRENYKLRKKETTIIERSTFASIDELTLKFYRRRIPTDYNAHGAFRRNNEEYESTKVVPNKETTSAPDTAVTTIESDITDLINASDESEASDTIDTPEHTTEAADTTDGTDASDTTDEAHASDSTDTTDKTNTFDITRTLGTVDTSDITDTSASEPLTTVLNTVSEQFLVDEANRIITTNEDLLQSQVASQLISELKAGMNEKSKLKKYTPDNTENERNNLYYMKLMKPTLKMYLGGSTRIPIPLPENHAFCYTNPKNLLCRASI